jgi:hypothetical protein
MWHNCIDKKQNKSNIYYLIFFTYFRKHNARQDVTRKWIELAEPDQGQLLEDAAGSDTESERNSLANPLPPGHPTVADRPILLHSGSFPVWPREKGGGVFRRIWCRTGCDYLDQAPPWAYDYFSCCCLSCLCHGFKASLIAWASGLLSHAHFSDSKTVTFSSVVYKHREI